MLGNDLVAGKVVADPIVTENPTTPSSEDEQIESEFCKLFPSCVVTCSMLKDGSKHKSSGKTDNGLEGTFKMNLDTLLCLPEKNQST